MYDFCRGTWSSAGGQSAPRDWCAYGYGPDRLPVAHVPFDFPLSGTIRYYFDKWTAMVEQVHPELKQVPNTAAGMMNDRLPAIAAPPHPSRLSTHRRSGRPTI